MSAGLEALSPRERELLRAWPDFGANNQLAASLGISTQTVKNHITSIHKKLGVRTIGQAVLMFDRWEHGRWEHGRLPLWPAVERRSGRERRRWQRRSGRDRRAP